MVKQRTFSIIKPDAVERNLIGQIYSRIEQAGMKIVAAKMLHLTQEQAAGFYAEHEGKPFYEGLIQNMRQGPIMVQVLEGEDVITRYRELMGSTDPMQAVCGSIRADYAVSMQKNSVHGSDSLESAQREIAFFFTDAELN